MTDARQSNGGPRPGAGRPPVPAPVVPVNIRMTAQQREKLRLLGGAKWVRSQIDASTPPAVQSPG